MGWALALLLAGCTNKGPGPGESEPESPAETDGDSGEPPSPDTGTVGLVYAADFDVVSGRFGGGSGGGEWRGEGGGLGGPLLCSLVGSWLEADPPKTPCPTCTYTFPLTLVGGVAEGDACARLAVDSGLLDGWSPTWGWAAEAVGYEGEILEDVLLLYYPPPYASWEVVAWAGDNRSEVAGTSTSLRFRVPGGLYYYLPAP